MAGTVAVRHGLRLRCRAMGAWPPLAWAARLRHGAPAVQVLHGPGVDAHSEWFGEVIWDRDYARGGFDETDLVFGSGGRVRQDRVIFVSAGSTLDRLHSLESKSEAWVSNSLVCLLSVAGAELELGQRAYSRAFQSIRSGLDRYVRTLPTSAGPVRLTYFHNLEWDGRRLILREKPFPRRDFGSFNAYRDFLVDALRRFAANMEAPGRSVPYAMLGTLSSGYDSSAVAALGREAGLRRAITFTTARGGEGDSGAEIGGHLGLQVRSFSRSAWEGIPLAQVPFLAGDAGGGDVFFKAAGSELSGAVLLTGYHGGAVWGIEPDTSPEIRRKDKSGLSLTEYRLWAGFIHCPVPFMGVRQAVDVVAITRSPEMEPWRLHTDYDRPIPRRILEEVDVPREAFGYAKRAAFVLSGRRQVFWQSVSSRDYLKWLDGPERRWLQRGSVPPRIRGRLLRPVQLLVHLALRIFRRATGTLPARWRTLWHFSQAELLSGHLFHWAIDVACARYRAPAAPGLNLELRQTHMAHDGYGRAGERDATGTG